MYVKNIAGKVLLPVFGALEDNDGVSLSWDNKEHHLDIQAFRNGTFDWFYINRLTNKLDGPEEDFIAILDVKTDLIKLL